MPTYSAPWDFGINSFFIFIEFILKYEDNFRESFAIYLSVSPNKTRDEKAKRKKRGTAVFFCRASCDGRPFLQFKTTLLGT